MAKPCDITYASASVNTEAKRELRKAFKPRRSTSFTQRSYTSQHLRKKTSKKRYDNSLVDISDEYWFSGGINTLSRARGCGAKARGSSLGYFLLDQNVATNASCARIGKVCRRLWYNTCLTLKRRLQFTQKPNNLAKVSNWLRPLH